MIRTRIAFRSFDSSKITVDFDTDADYSPDVADDLRKQTFAAFTDALAAANGMPCAELSAAVTMTPMDVYEEIYSLPNHSDDDQG